MNKLLDALDSVVWYNQLVDFFDYIKEGLIKEKNKGKYCFSLMPRCNDTVKTICENDSVAIGQCEMFWMIMVEMFGSCGTSPRSGWLDIENYDAIIKFINSVTKTAREVREETESI